MSNPFLSCPNPLLMLETSVSGKLALTSKSSLEAVFKVISPSLNDTEVSSLDVLTSPGPCGVSVSRSNLGVSLSRNF